MLRDAIGPRDVHWYKLTMYGFTFGTRKWYVRVGMESNHFKSLTGRRLSVNNVVSGIDELARNAVETRTVHLCGQ